MSHPQNLNQAELEALGVAGWPFGMVDKVRFAELDPLNHVNNVALFTWFENIRVPYLIARGLTNYSHTDDDPQLVVRYQNADYLKPLYQDEVYVVTARTRVLKPTSLVMEHAVFVSGELRVKGEVVIVSLTQDGSARREHKPRAINEILELDSPERA